MNMVIENAQQIYFHTKHIDALDKLLNAEKKKILKKFAAQISSEWYDLPDHEIENRIRQKNIHFDTICDCLTRLYP